MQKIDELKGENQATAGELGQEIFQFACNLACRLAEEIFKEMEMMP